MFLRRLSLLVVIAAATCAPSARAVTKKECIEAHVDSQRLRREAKLKEARDRLLVCADDGCIKVVRKDCLTWLDEVNASLPTIVVVATGKDGKETSDVRVFVDDELVSDGLEGKAIEIDPGTHRIRYEMDDTDPVEEQVMVSEGERNKILKVSFAPEPPEAEPTEPKDQAPPPRHDAEKDEAPGPPITMYVLGGVGAAALIGTGFFWLSSQSQIGDLENSGCEPDCSRDDVDSIKSKRLIGDVLLGVGVLSLGAAAYLWTTQPPAKGREARRGPRVDVGALPGGGFASVRGTF